MNGTHRFLERLGFKIGVLNHLLQDESLLLTFTADEDFDPRLPGLAAEILNRSSY